MVNFIPDARKTKKKPIDLNKLRQGDLVFFKPIVCFDWKDPLGFFISKLISFFSSITIHVAPIVNDPTLTGEVKIFSAEGTGMELRVIALCDCYYFMRIKGATQDDIKQGIIKSYERYWGKSYGFLTAIKAGVFRKLGLRSLYIKHMLPTCSYHSAMFVIDVMEKNPVPSIPQSEVLPDDLYKSKLLEEITKEQESTP